MSNEVLQEEVTKILVTKYDFLPDQASRLIEESLSSDATMWNENANPADLAECLAEDSDME